MPTPATILTRRDLNRALLARQLLLSRETRTAEEAIEQVAGLQAQLARPPFIGLWSRLPSFDKADLLRALHARTIVRVTAMRGTLFLLSARDYKSWRGALQPALTRGVESISGVPLTQLDLPAAEAEARAFLGKQAATFDAIRNHLTPRFPSVNVRHLAMPNIIAGRSILPELIQRDATADRIAREALDILDRPERRQAMRADLAEVIAALGPPGACQRAAECIRQVLRRD